MNRYVLRTLIAAALALASTAAFTQDLLIRNAKVHTASSAGTLDGHDVLVRKGTIAAIGRGLTVANVPVVEANGRPLTPALFGGVTGIGIEEITLEPATNDGHLTFGESAKDIHIHPEFDVTRAYNPASILIPNIRNEGIGFTLLGADSRPGGSIIGGQGGIVRFDGRPDPLGGRVLFITLGTLTSPLSGDSRAGQWLILEQLIDELRGRIPPDSHLAHLTPAGRSVLKRYIDEGRPIAIQVERAADIRQTLRWTQQHRLNIAIIGGSEAWQLAPELVAANVPVFVDPLTNLPANFDKLGASLKSAARLHAAGVRVGITPVCDVTHFAAKMRQRAGNAVAHGGLPWEDGLAALTRVPAEAFGVGDEIGSIEVGKRADLVLWEGDPLDVAHLAEQVWLGGQAQPMHSRQRELRDRYLRAEPDRAAGTLPLAYPDTP